MINFIAPINQLSYGVVGLNILKQMSRKEGPALWPIGGVYLENKDDQPLVKAAILNQDHYDPLAPCLRLYHQFSLAEFVGKGKHIGWPIFELDRFTAREKHHISACDEIVVCSKWAADIVKDQTGRTASVVNLGVDTSLFSPANKKPKKDHYTFLVVGKIELRKGMDVIPQIFKSAFNQDKKYRLRMAWGNPFLKPEQVKEWENYYRSELGDLVTFVDRLPTQNDVANEMRAADAGICLSRAEGWDLPALEMLACGLPIVGSNCTAHTEFLDKNNSELVYFNSSEPANDGIWFHGQGSWVEFNNHAVDQAVSALRGVAKRLDSGYNINSAGLETAGRFSWENSYNQLEKVL